MESATKILSNADTLLDDISRLMSEDEIFEYPIATAELQVHGLATAELQVHGLATAELQVHGLATAELTHENMQSQENTQIYEDSPEITHENEHHNTKSTQMIINSTLDISIFSGMRKDLRDNIIQKYKTILTYLDQFKDRPQQGTAEWVNERGKTIGGSEIAKLFGISHDAYSSAESLKIELMKTKLGLDKFTGNKFTKFGNICEDILCRFIEKTYNTKIVGDMASIKNGKYQSYSPDGISVVCGAPPYGMKSGSLTVDTILWEFKCPWSRMPKAGVPPPQYVPQVLLGLGTMPFCDYGVLVEAVIRRCPMSDLNFTSKFNKEPVAATGTVK